VEVVRGLAPGQEAAVIEFARNSRQAVPFTGSAPALPTGGDGVEQLNMLERIADAQRSTTDKITHLFLAAVARPPSPSEVDMAREVIKSHRGNVAAAVYDIWWALTASNELVWDN
jgi:hypothetical protein